VSAVSGPTVYKKDEHIAHPTSLPLPPRHLIYIQYDSSLACVYRWARLYFEIPSNAVEAADNGDDDWKTTTQGYVVTTLH
jgi:hypothetical protein